MPREVRMNTAERNLPLEHFGIEVNRVVRNNFDVETLLLDLWDTRRYQRMNVIFDALQAILLDRKGDLVCRLVPPLLEDPISNQHDSGESVLEGMLRALHDYQKELQLAPAFRRAGDPGEVSSLMVLHCGRILIDTRTREERDYREVEIFVPSSNDYCPNENLERLRRVSHIFRRFE